MIAVCGSCLKKCEYHSYKYTPKDLDCYSDCCGYKVIFCDNIKEVIGMRLENDRWN